MNNEIPQKNLENKNFTLDQLVDDPILEQKKQAESERYKLLLKKVRENKIVYYGYPIFVIILFGVSIFYFVLPAIESFFNYNNYVVKYTEDKKILDQNFSNLIRAQSNYSLLLDYENRLAEILPEEILVGNLVDQLQQKADYYGLERSIAEDREINEDTQQPETTTVNKAKFTRLGSGEYEFVPDFVTNNRGVGRLIKINLEITGPKDKFLDFMKDVENSTPILNLIFLEYQEEYNEKVKVSATFETYSLKPNDKLNPKIYLLDIPNDYKLIKDFSFLVEDFEVDNVVITVLEKIFTRIRSNSLPDSQNSDYVSPGENSNSSNNNVNDYNDTTGNEDNFMNDASFNSSSNEEEQTDYKITNPDIGEYSDYYDGGIYDELDGEIFEDI